MVIFLSSSLGRPVTTTACSAVESCCHDSMAILDRLDVKASRLEVRFKFGRDWSVKLLSQILEMASSFLALSLLSGSKGKASSFSSANDLRSK